MLQQRKGDHLNICLREDVEFRHPTAGFERYRLIPRALPDLSPDDVDLSTRFLGKLVQAPILISPMTGGIPQARDINRRLAAAAEAMGIAMGVGSQRAAIEEPGLADTYRVRDVAPHIVLLANLGAVQLNYGYGLDQCRRAVEMIEADALVLHLNPLQECLQEDGNRDFRGLLPKIEGIVRRLGAPVIVKEVGWGLSPEVVQALLEVGVSAVDVAGAGGTSWARVEAHRAGSERIKQLAAAFDGWGIPTAEAIRSARTAAGPDAVIVGSGGVRDGLQAAKALALGANLVGVALPLLRPATISAEAVAGRLGQLASELRLAAFLTGSRSVEALRRSAMVAAAESPGGPAGREGLG